MVQCFTSIAHTYKNCIPFSEQHAQQFQVEQFIIGNKLRVMLDWTLDLFVERSSSQIHATRVRLETAGVHDEAHAHEPAKVA